MAKLRVIISLPINTGPLIVHNHKTHKRELVEGSILESMIAAGNSERIGFSLAAAHDGIFVSFVFNRTSGIKGAVIEVNAKSDKSGLKGKIEGQFEVKLRPGVAPLLQQYGSGLDLRFVSLTLNDGAWSGFDAFPAGIDGRNKLDVFFTELTKITDFTVK
jgi:hypothetical protein